MKMRFSFWMRSAIMVVGMCLSVGAGTFSVAFPVPFDEGNHLPPGWSHVGISSSGGYAYFNAISDVMQSPVFDHALTNVAVTCKCSNATAQRRLTIIPLTVTPGGQVVTNAPAAVFVPGTETSMQEAAFDAGLNANAFLIGMTGSGNGSWTVYSVTVRHTGPEILEAATGLQNENVTGCSFSAVWSAVLAAESYALRVWQESVGDPSYAASHFEQTFDSQSNGNLTAKKIDAELETRLGEGWSGSTVYLPAQSGGILQIGNGSSKGWLMTPSWTGAAVTDATLLIRARRYPSDKEGTRMPVDLVRAGTANVVAEFTLTDAWADYAAPLENMIAGDRLLFHSLTNGSGKRAMVDSVRIVSGYEPGIVSTNEIFMKDGITGTVQTVTDLSEGIYQWAVRADASGEDGIWSETKTVLIATGNDADDDPDDPPKPQATTGLKVTHVSSNSFSVAWTDVQGADGYLVTVSTNGIVPAREGVVLWQERFSRVFRTDAATKIPMESLKVMSDWPNWSGTNIFTCTTADSAVQLGNTSTHGVLATGPLNVTGEGRVLKFTAWRMKEGRNFPIDVVCGTETNWTADVALSQTPTEYVVPLPELSASDGLVFHSTTNAQYGRVCLDEIAILSDYVPQTTTTVAVVDGLLTTACNFSLEGLLTTRFAVQVSVVAGGVTNVGETVEIDLAHTPFFGAWRLSSFEDGAKEGDFEPVRELGASSVPWTNGVTVAGFHAYKKGEDVTTIGRDDGNETTAGLYATSREAEDGVWNRSLSLLGSGSSDVALELHILNDGPARKILKSAYVDFTAYQWTFPVNSAGGVDVRTLAADWAVTEDASVRPNESAWHEVAATAFDSGAKPEDAEHRAEDRSFETGRIVIPAGGMLLVRWRVAKAAKSPMFGVGNVRVRMVADKEPTQFLVR